MAEMYAVKGSTLTDIANALREKGGDTEAKYTVDEMAEAIHGLSGDAVIEPFDALYAGTYEAPAGVDGFSPITTHAYHLDTSTIENVDKNLKWHCPDDWDDPRTIVRENFEYATELYLVYRTDLYKSYASFAMTGGNWSVQSGHVVDGVFMPITEREDRASNSYLKLMLENDFETSGKNTIVFRLTSVNKITAVPFSTVTDPETGVALTANMQTLVMRYGTVPTATSLSCNSYYMLECDELFGLVGLTSCASMYNTCYSLKRWRHDDWDTSKVTTFASMFAQCWQLVDADMNLDGWVTAKTTTIASMFNTMRSYRGDLILTGWVTDNITTISGLFYNCYNIERLIGIEDWYLPKCITYSASSAYLFYNLMCLWQNEDRVLDLSHWHLGETATSTAARSFTYLFYGLHKIKEINFSNVNMTYASSFAYFCSNNRGLERLVMKNNTLPTAGVLTSLSNMFASCNQLKEIDIDTDGVFDGWNFSKTTTFAGLFSNCYRLKRIDCGTPATEVLGSSSNTTMSTMFEYCINAEYIDMSFLDASKYTYTNTQLAALITADTLLVDFYPPRHIHKAATFNQSIRLSHDSLIRILEALDPVSASTKLTIGAINLAKLSAEDRAIATGKNWTLA